MYKSITVQTTAGLHLSSRWNLCFDALYSGRNCKNKQGHAQDVLKQSYFYHDQFQELSNTNFNCQTHKLLFKYVKLSAAKTHTFTLLLVISTTHYNYINKYKNKFTNKDCKPGCALLKHLPRNKVQNFTTAAIQL